MEPEKVQQCIDAHFFGVNTSRYCSTLIYEGDKVLTPMGPNLVLWDMKTLSRVRIIQESQSLIMCLFENSSVIASVSYSGDIVFFDKKTLKVIDRIKTQQILIRHGAMNEDFIAICAEEGKAGGVTEVFDIRCLKKDSSMKGIEKVLHLEGRWRYPALTDNGTLFITKERRIYEPGVKEDDYPAEPKGPQGPKPFKRDYTYHNFSLETKKETCEPVAGNLVADIINASSNERDRVALVYLTRRVVILNSKTLEVLYNVNIGEAGAIVGSRFDEYSVFLSPKSNFLLEIKAEKAAKLPEDTVVDYKQYLDKDDDPHFRTFQLQSLGLCPKNYSFIWNKKYETAVTCNEDGIFLLDFKAKKAREISLFSITCCGLALSHSGRLVAAGDFGGNVMIFSTESVLENEPIFRTLVFDNSRAIVWDTEDKSIIIGGLSGQIYRWFYENPEAMPEPVFAVEGGVMNMRMREFKGEKGPENYLLVGTGAGAFYIFRDFGGVLDLVGKYLGHSAQVDNKNMDFGSLKHFAEIWSVIFSPHSREHLVTASEDQTCRVWNASDFYNPITTTEKKAELLHKLEGHTLAVTSIDWKVMNERLGEVFISCSDDHHIRVYSPRDGFKFLYEDYTTRMTREWHTLTYLALEPDGHRVAIGAQNGYFFVYDLILRQFVYADKLHMGSIEGLDWKKDVIATCSSDNTICLVRLQRPKL